MDIPKIIHFIWISWYGEKYPDIYNSNLNKIQKLNPGYRVIIWDYLKIDQEIKKNLKEYYNLYNSLPNLIYKHRFSKIFILYIYGGIYMNFDLKMNKPFDQLLSNENFYLFRKENIITASIIASKPHNIFIREWLKHIHKIFDRDAFHHKENIDKVCGSYCLNTFYNNNKNLIKENQIIDINNKTVKKRALVGWKYESETEHIDPTTYYIIFFVFIMIVLLIIFSFIKK